MKMFRWPLLRQLRDLLEETAPAPEQVSFRLKTIERDVILPVKGVFILILLYNLYFSKWFEDVPLPQSVAQQLIQRFFIFYLLASAVVAGFLIFGRKLPSSMIQRVIFTSSFLDALFVAALAYVTGGFNSVVYWLFLGLIVRNALSCPLAVPQLVLNFSVSLCYLGAGILDIVITDSSWEYQEMTGSELGTATEPFVLRLIVLVLTTICCYGLQVLFEKQRRAAEEAREFAVRQEQLRSAGQLAAKIAHQIKNPLGIINNAAYSIQRSLQEGKSVNPQQIEIIREEISRADHTITKLMGYAQLAEGKVERITVVEELDRAIELAVPPAAKYPVTVVRDYGDNLPVLMMQRAHLSEVLVNLIQNAREAMVGKGTIKVSARASANSVVITVADDGPGISKTRLDKVFQPYFTTKEKGTGLGLSIVKHNTELYNGTVQVESELGKGTRFILTFPTRTIRT